MSLRAKLLLGLAPLALAVLVISIAGGFFLKQLGQSSERVLQDNYRTLLALQRMSEALDELDSWALLVITGRREEPSTSSARGRFEAELAVQEGDLTEAGEREATEKLREAWRDYVRRYERFLSQASPDGLRTEYFESLRPAYVAVKGAADPILAMNQDAMVRKSDEAKRTADRSVTLLILVSAAGFLIALYASAGITNRLLRPLSVLGQAARRLGEGDLGARARVEGRDELAQLAVEFNAMAERIRKYRQSSLGELLEAQQASQAAIDSLPDPVLVLGTGGELLHLNRASENTLRIGLEKVGLAGLEPGVRAAVEKAHQHVMSGKGPFAPRGLDEALRVVTPEGERHLLPRATPVYAEGGAVAGATLILQDVTRLLRFEELRNNLVATVAHEFRTPLTSLRMAIHLLIERAVGQLSDKHADLLYAAREDCERLQAIVDELLDLSRIQAGRVELRRTAVEAEAVVKTAVEAQRAAAAERHVQLKPLALPGPKVSVDVERLQLVLSNLLGNAIRHSPEGGSVIARAAVEGPWVRFEVSDQGPGIPKQYHHAVFDKYFQVPDSASGGAGLGLFICKELVHAHDGEIGIDSGPGQGSTFWFKLPLVSEQGTVE